MFDGALVVKVMDSLQGLAQLHRIVLGLDVLGNPVKVVRGVVSGTVDLFYEPIKVQEDTADV